MTPSIKPVTEGQIGKLNQKITARLLKNKDKLPSYLFQKALADYSILDEIFEAIHKRAGVMVKTILVHDCEIEIIFFKPELAMRDSELEEQYALRELEPVDQYLLNKFNQNNPSFCENYPNATHWKNEGFLWSFAGFEYNNNSNGKVFSFDYKTRHLSSSMIKIDKIETHAPCRNSIREGYYDNTQVNDKWRKGTWFAGLRKKITTT